MDTDVGKGNEEETVNFKCCFAICILKAFFYKIPKALIIDMIGNQEPERGTLSLSLFLSMCVCVCVC